MINLDKFTEDKIIIAPLLNGTFQYNRKKYSSNSNTDGWYELSINGNKCNIIKPVTIEFDFMKIK